MKKSVGICIIIVILCVLSAAFGNAEPQKAFLMNFTTLYVRKNNYSIEYPLINVIHSKEELQNYYKESFGIWGVRLEEQSSLQHLQLSELLQRYDPTFFTQKYLVIVELLETSGSIRHKVISISESGEIYIAAAYPAMQTADMAAWNILIELDVSHQPENFTVYRTYSVTD